MRAFPGRAAALAVVIVGCGGRPPATVAIAAPPGPPPPIMLPLPAAEDPSAPELGKEGAADPDEASAGPAEVAVRGWLGVELEPAGLGEAGARIVRVVPRSPAEAAGLAPGDVIVRLDDRAVSSPQEVIAIVKSEVAGTRVGVVLKRAGNDRIAAVTLGGLPEREELYRMGFVDQPAPAFDGLATVKGSLAPTLLAQRGQVVIVEFWAPWCTACRALIPHMNRWHAQYAARGVRVIGITTDPVPRAAAAASELGMDYSILSDTTQQTSRAYQVGAIPALFLIDRAGTVRDVVLGYDAPRLAKLDALVQRLVAER